MRALAAVACLLTTHAHAALLGSVQLPLGNIDLFNDAGLCKAQALRAVYVPAQGEPVPGCWVSGSGMVFIVFFDAGIARFPASEIKPTKGV